MKTLRDISWKVSEEQYREDPALSYSLISKFDRDGFSKLNTLMEKTDSPSLFFGSQVDTWITEGEDAYNAKYTVYDVPLVKESVKNVVEKLFEENKDTFNTLDKIPIVYIMAITHCMGFQPNWKPETRVKTILEQGAEYYKALFKIQGKTIVSTEDKDIVRQTVTALKTNPASSMYFSDADDFLTREYQLKFKSVFDNIEFKCMADLLVTDHHNKIVIPVDLKTSSNPEWDFYDSFVKWNYSMQARLYWKIIRDNMDKDEYFKDFVLTDYRFVVVNKNTLTPLVWEFEDTQKEGTLVYGKEGKTVLKDPIEVGKTLDFYLKTMPKVPMGIKETEPNSIVQYLNNK